jgi:diacylglycerol O-acyltransferase / wax synthase
MARTGADSARFAPPCAAERLRDTAPVARARLDRLGFDDAEILRLESPSVAGHTLKLLVLERSPGPLELEAPRDRVATRLDREPRARQRVAFTPLRLGPPSWVDDDRFDLDRHIRRLAGTEGIDDAGLRRAAGEVMSDRLDPSMPLWALDLVGPLADGRAAILARIHHAMADGISSLRLLGALLWDEAEDGGAPSSWRPDPPPSGLALAAEAVRDRAAAVGPAAIRLARAAATPSRWTEGARALIALPGAVRRELRPGAEDPELDQAIGLDRELAFASIPLAELKAIGHSRPGHVTVNDVLLAAVAGALRRRLERGSEEGALRAQVPVSLHHRYERADELGNRDSFLNVDLPLDEPDPLRRLERINAETAERKSRSDPEELYDLFHALSRVRPLYRAASRLSSGPREFALAVSNVPGPPDPVSVAGRRVEGLASFAEPAPHHALRVSAISNAGALTVGFCSDPGALSGLDGLADAFSAAVEELRGATGA